MTSSWWREDTMLGTFQSSAEAVRRARALSGSPACFGRRGNGTSMPRHRSPPIRPGENNPRPDHGTKILRSGKLSRARHTSPPGKGGEAGPQNDRQPVPATTRAHLHLPSRKPTFQEVQNQPGQIEASDLASILTPKSSLQKKTKKHLVSI